MAKFTPMVPWKGRCAALLFAVLLLASFTGPVAAAGEPATTSTAAGATLAGQAPLPGDINADGQVSAVDALLALQMTTGKIPPAAVADMDGDGVVRVNDVLLILENSAKTGLAAEKGGVRNPDIKRLAVNKTSIAPEPGIAPEGVKVPARDLSKVENVTRAAVPREIGSVGKEKPVPETPSPSPTESRLWPSVTPEPVAIPKIELPVATPEPKAFPRLVEETPATPARSAASTVEAGLKEPVPATPTETPVVRIARPVATLDPCIASGGTLCPAGSSTGTCAYLLQDLLNCGSCGHACPQGVNGVTTCNNGQCGIVCSTGFGNCDSVLENGCETDLMTSAGNCGACGVPCKEGQCVEGKCIVPLKKTLAYRRL